jgi:2-methylcitrate dehydratase PrpD
VIHPVLDAILALRRTHDLAPLAVERIVVAGHPHQRQRTDRPDVKTGREAQVSVQHSVAAALVFGQIGLEHYTDACVQNPAVLDLRRKVEVTEDPSIAVEGAAVSVWTSDGQHHEMMVEHALGTPGRPLSDSQLEQKFIANASGLLEPSAMRRLMDAIWTLDRSDDAGSLMALTVPGQAEDLRAKRRA